MKLKELPVLEGWISLPDAARKMNISRQRIHQLVDAGRFTTACRIGTFAIVREAEVDKLLTSREVEEARKEEEEPNVGSVT